MKFPNYIIDIEAYDREFFAILLLLYRMRTTKNCLGLSLKTQEIYLIVFLIRYTDLFYHFVSVYNSCMKIIFIGTTTYIIYLMRFKKPFCTTYDTLVDQFPHLKILLPSAAALTAVCHSGTGLYELTWSYSLWLEALAFIPQILMLQRTRIIENITNAYAGALGLYRLFYIINWIYRYQTEGHFCWTQTLSGSFQTLMYAVFVYLFHKAVKDGRPVRYEVLGSKQPV